jgi:hypothetical protein
MQELFLGVDFHKKSSFVTGMTGKGQVVLQGKKWGRMKKM